MEEGGQDKYSPGGSKGLSRLQLGGKAPFLPPESLGENPQYLNFQLPNWEDTLVGDDAQSPQPTVKGSRHACFIRILGSLCLPKHIGH